MNQYGKSKATKKAEAEALGVDSSNKIDISDSDSDSEIDEYVLKHSRTEVVLDGDDGNTAEGVEVYNEITLEDIIEAQRAKLAAEGKQGKHR